MVKLSYKVAAVIIVALVVSTAGFVAYNGTLTNSGQSTGKTTITVTDLENRTVTLNAPVERIVITESSHTADLGAVYGDDFTNIIVGWDTYWKDYFPDYYEKYISKYPELVNIPDVGQLDAGTFSVEKVISLKPDVVFLQSWGYMWAEDATKDAVGKLEQAGIPVVFLDFYIDPLVNSPKSMLLLGQIFNRESRAQEIVDFYNEQTNFVYSRLANITGPKPTVYVECAYVTPPEYGISYGDVAHGAIIKKVRGDNIAESLLGNGSKTLSAEYVISQNPDVVILTGGNWTVPGSISLGYTTSLDVARSTMSGFVERPGWEALNAVKNHKVYGVHHDYIFTIYNFAVVQAFAKWFYPAEFQDIDPNAALAEYHERFLPIDYSGTFMFSYY